MGASGGSRFVGRARELDAVLSLGARGEAALAWVSGVGGIGKTTLLREVGRRARLEGKRVATLSLDRVNPSPGELLASAAATLGQGGDLASMLAGGHLLVLDALEHAPWLEGWLLDELSQAPASGGLVLVGSRDAPSLGWLSPHLGERFLHLPLSPFEAPECEAFLGACGVEAARHGALSEFSRGHPLTLAVLAQSQARTFSAGTPGGRPDLLQAILGGIIERSLAPRQRAALEAAAQVPSLNEPLLRALLGEHDVYDLLAWLQSRPYTSMSPSGLLLHELVVDVVSAELRWRDPARANELAGRAFDHLSVQLSSPDPQVQRWAGDSFIWMLRHMPGAEDLFTHSQRDLYLGAPRGSDGAAMRALLSRADGPEAVAVFERHRAERPASLAVVRGAGQALKSFWLDLNFPSDDLRACSFDPAVASVAAILQSLGVSPRAPVSVQRWHLDADTLREPGVTMGLSTIREMRAMVTVPGLQLRFFVAPADCSWGPRWEALGYLRHKLGAFSLDGRPFDCWFLDFRERSSTAFLRGIFSFGNLPRALPEPAPRLAAPAPPERGDVRTSLQALLDLSLLARTPLIALLPPGSPEARARALRGLLVAEIEALGATGRGQRLRRALQATYLDPPDSQEAIAERLRLPFRTYRDHLSQGIDELARRLADSLPSCAVVDGDGSPA